MFRRLFILNAFLLLIFHQGFSQINIKEHPILVKELTKVYFDTTFKKEQGKIINESWQSISSYQLGTNNPIEVGKVCFTIKSCALKFGSSFTKSKPSNTVLPKGSMVWILSYEREYDSTKLDSVQFLYFINYKVYVPSLKKIAFINAKYLPNFCISTRGYSNLDTLKPQLVGNFQQYHSRYNNVPQKYELGNFGDPIININQFISNWIHINDRVFQVYVQKHPDSSQLQINVETGLVNSSYNFITDAQNSSAHLGSSIFPWIYGSQGLMGVRNIVDIQHWADACGEEGGSTYFTFMEQSEPLNGLVKLGDFHSVSDAGNYAYFEVLVFPIDTIELINGISTEFTKIHGEPNYLIQINQTLESEDYLSQDVNDYPETKTSSEMKYTKWNRNPTKFKKIPYKDPCKPAETESE